MPNKEEVIKGLRDIDMFIAERLGYEKAKNFLRAIDEAVVMLKEQDKRIAMKQIRIDQLCKQLTELKHKFHEKTELVRCKYCRFAFYKDGLVAKGNIFCTKPGTERGQAVKPDDWYCADGERRDDNA